MSSAAYRTFTQYKPIDEITLSHIHQMHLVHQHAYPDVSLDDFIAHMCGQSGAVLVRRRADRLIVGFSALKLARQAQGRLLAHGPLVIHDAYRQRHGHARALQWLTWLERCKYPFLPLRVVRAEDIEATPPPAWSATQAVVSHALQASPFSGLG
jgi:hypothetical protein